MATKPTKTNVTGSVKQSNKVDRSNESAEQKFLRLALPRVNKAIKAIGQVARLGARQYASTQDQRDKIQAAISEALELSMRQLNGTKTVSKFNF